MAGALTLYAGVLFGLYIAAVSMGLELLLPYLGIVAPAVGASQEETTAVRGASTPNLLQTGRTTDDP
jgi:hypothetical protein